MNSICSMRRLAVAIAIVLADPSRAAATWSIVAVDPDTGEVGSAGASCTSYVAGIVSFVPGRAVIVAQALSNNAARNHAALLLKDRKTPAEALQAIANAEFDKDWQGQQYGIAALTADTPPVAFTGAATHGWSGDKQGPGFSVQGNLLTGPEVVGDAHTAFVRAGLRKATLAERLLAALEAGAEAGGDKRCGVQRAQSAYLVVAKPNDSSDAPSIGLVVPGQWQKGGHNAVTVLRSLFDRLNKSTKAATTSTP